MELQGKKNGMLALSILAGLVWASMAPLYLFFGVYLRSLGLTYGGIDLTTSFLLSILLSCLSMGAATSFLTISLAQLGIEPFFLGIVIATGGLFEVPSMYIGGLLCDRIGSFAVLSIGEVGLAAVYWLYGTVTNITTYVLVQGLRGTLYAVFTVSGMAASSGLGGRSRGSLYAGLYNLSYYLGSVPGPYMGGLVSDYMGLSAMFTLSSAISIASAALLIPCGLAPTNRRK